MLRAELSPLERAMHALHSGMEIKAYAEMLGQAITNVRREVMAARVAESHMGFLIASYGGPPEDIADLMGVDRPARVDVRLHPLTRQLAEIHAAPEWLWPALVVEPAPVGVPPTRGR